MSIRMNTFSPSIAFGQVIHCIDPQGDYGDAYLKRVKEQTKALNDSYGTQLDPYMVSNPNTGRSVILVNGQLDGTRKPVPNSRGAHGSRIQAEQSDLQSNIHRELRENKGQYPGGPEALLEAYTTIAALLYQTAQRWGEEKPENKAEWVI